MAEIFRLEVFTPLRCVRSLDVESVTLPAYDGEVGVLPGHRDFVGLLGTGRMVYAGPTETGVLMVSSGYYEVANGRLGIYAEFAEEPKEISEARARERLRELTAEFEKLNYYSENYASVSLEISREQARLAVLT